MPRNALNSAEYSTILSYREFILVATTTLPSTERRSFIEGRKYILFTYGFS